MSGMKSHSLFYIVALVVSVFAVIALSLPPPQALPLSSLKEQDVQLMDLESIFRTNVTGLASVKSPRARPSLAASRRNKRSLAKRNPEIYQAARVFRSLSLPPETPSCLSNSLPSDLRITERS